MCPDNHNSRVRAVGTKIKKMEMFSACHLNENFFPRYIM